MEHGLAGESVSLGEGFEVSIEPPFSASSPLSPACGSGCNLSAAAPTPCLPARCHAPHDNGHGLFQLRRCKLQINTFLYKLPFITAAAEEANTGVGSFSFRLWTFKLLGDV